MEDAIWHPPAKHAINAQISTRVKRHEEHIGSGRVWRLWPELALEKAETATAAQLVCNHTNGDRPLAGEGGELGVHHHLAEGAGHPSCPRSRLITGWSLRYTRWSPKA